MKTLLLLVLLGLTASLAGTVAAQGPLALDAAKLKLQSSSALVYDASANAPIYAKAAQEVTPIASLTKLMTAMVTLDAGLPMDEHISIGIEDIDFLKGSSSRLRLGIELSREEMLRLALMASENRAASSLARHYPGGTSAFVAAMNAKAKLLALEHTHFVEPTGLSAENVSTAGDLATMVAAAATYPMIREFSTTQSHYVSVEPTGQIVGFNNTNGLVKSPQWDILLSKTGYIREAGRCLVMVANIASKPFVIVLLDSLGKYSRVADAVRVKHWLETGEALPLVKEVTAAKVKKASKRVSGKFEPRARFRQVRAARGH